MKLNDYMSAGRPTLATAVGDVPALIESEDIGRVTDDNPIVFAQETLQLLEDPYACQSYGEQARLVAVNKLSWDSLAHDVLDFYERMLAKTS